MKTFQNYAIIVSEVKFMQITFDTNENSSFLYDKILSLLIKEVKYVTDLDEVLKLCDNYNWIVYRITKNDEKTTYTLGRLK